MTSEMHPTMSGSLAKIEWQDTIFAAQPQRLDLLRLKTNWPCNDISIRVHRNAPFEYVQQVMGPFLAYADSIGKYIYSDYDDSLNFSLQNKSADIEIVWLDYERYRNQMEPLALVNWLQTRLTILRQYSAAPILMNNWPANHKTAMAFNDQLTILSRRVSGFKVIDLQAIHQELGDVFFDQRLAKVGATTYSGRANILTARAIGLTLIPESLRPRLKAVAVDLDNTLYSGVLGEDGLDGVTLTAHHKALQEQLHNLRAQGLFLAIISKNEMEDVEALLETRVDFPLKKSDFSVLSVCWGAKSSGLSTIAQKLRIGLDSILYLDDNIGELAEVTNAHPNIKIIYAADTYNALRALKDYPNIQYSIVDETDSLRINDLAAAEKRTFLIETAASTDDYLASLETTLTISVNAAEQLDRAHSLANKTNQFILSLRRFTEAEVVDWSQGEHNRIVTISLSDRLSNSGNIAVLFLKRNGKTIEISEFCVSCRALGRNIENLLLVKSLECAYPGFTPDTLIIQYTNGPRNQPGLTWLTNFAAQELGEQGQIALTWPTKKLMEILETPVAVKNV